MAAKKIIVCDSNVFFEHFRGNKSVQEQLDQIGYGKLYLSVVTIGEIYQGMYKSEKRKSAEQINKFGRIDFDKALSEKFVELMLGYFDKGLTVADALIAATCLTHKAKLFTRNRKDFDFIKGIKFFDP